MRRQISILVRTTGLILMCISCNDGAGTLFQPDGYCPDPVVQVDAGTVREYMVPMRDCIELATNVAFPEGEGPFPVIVVRSPYGKGGGSALGGLGLENVFPAFGYAVVSQDTRGRFNSQGDFVPFINEREDGADTLAWIERQPWFNGQLGVWGASYLGATAMLMALERPDLVKAATIAVITSEIYTVAYEHGILRADIGGSWALIMHKKDELSIPDPAMQESAMLQFPLVEADKRTVGEVAFDDPFYEEDTNGDFYLQEVDPQNWRSSNVPIQMVTGWFDFMVKGQMNDYRAMVEHRAGKDLYLTIGPWNHLMGLQPDHDWDFPDYGGLPFLFDDTIRFFDHYLKDDKGQSAAELPIVSWYDGGLGEWHTSARLFTEDTKTVTWYAADISAAGACGTPGSLLQSKPSAFTEAGFTYDPTDVAKVPGAMVLHFDRAGMKKDLDWCAREDAIVLETPALTEPMEIQGDLTVNLIARSDAADSPFYVRLSLVDTDGTAYNLREGAMLASYRQSDDYQVPYISGSWVELEIPLAALRWTLQPGQKLRLNISGAAYPFVVPHPNLDGDWKAARTPVVSRQTVAAGPVPASAAIDSEASGSLGMTRLRIQIAR